MKIFKRLLLVAVVLFVLVLGAAAAFPFVFKDEILAAVKKEINVNLTAKVDFDDVNLSLFRHFPHVSVGLENYSVVGTGVFDKITLAKGELLDVEVDLSSFWNKDKPLKINSVHLKRPNIKVYVLEDGRANYNIVKTEETTVVVDSVTGDTMVVEPTPFEINLDGYSISDGKILYQDATSDLYLSIEGLHHRGKGNFTQDVFDLETDTKMAALTLRYGSIPYLKEAVLDLKATFQIETPLSKYTLKDNNLRINDLQLRADGFVQMLENDDIGMDIQLSTPQNDFKALLSLIPNAYIQNYEQVKAGGRFEFAAEAKGIYNGVREVYPAFNIRLAVADGSVQYPDLPMTMQRIQAEMSVNSPGGNLDALSVNVPRFGLLVGNRPFDLVFFLKTPLSDPDLDAKMKGVIHLAEWAKAFPMEGIGGGIIDADARIKTRMSYIDNGQYDRVDMSGKVAIQNLRYQSEDMPPIYIQSLSTVFAPQRVEISRFEGKLGESDLKAQGSIKNILAYFSPQKTMYGNLAFSAQYFNINEWMPKEKDAEPVPSIVDAAPAGAMTPAAPVAGSESSPVFDRFDFTVDGSIREVVYSDYRLLNTYAKGNIKPNRMEIAESGFLIGESDLQASGLVLNMFDYLFNNGTLGGNLKINSRLMNLNQFMGSSAPSEQAVPVPSSNSNTSNTSDTPDGSGYAPVMVPANVKMAIDANIGRLIYTDYELNNLDGQLVVEDETVVVRDAVAGFLGGKVGLTGSYDTRDSENPAFSMKYDMQNMSFQRLFKALNTFKMLSPLAGYIDGNFNTTLIMDGKLGDDLMPKLATLNVKGFLETLNGVISNFKPFQELGSMLDVSYLKDNIVLTNTKNWFEIQNGIVELKEFDYKYKDIDMKISGTHALMQDMHYKIKARVPRKLLEKNAAGATASRGYDLLRKEASKFGVNLQKNEFVNMLIDITGSTTKPKVALRLLGADGETPVDDAAKDELKAEVEKAKDEVKQQVDQKIEEGKQIVRETADKAVDSVKTIANQKLEELEKEAKETAKEKLGEIVGDKIDSTALKKAQEMIDKNKEAERIKKELEKFNPLKKKKEGGGR